MHSSMYLAQLAAFFAAVNAHGVILAAVGDAGGPASVGFAVESSIARNCTLISPCQQDTTILRQSEMDAGIIGQCGRTQIAGNVDYVNGTETQLAANAVTKVTKGGSLVMTIHQVNADGAGPYTCDLDQDEAPPSMQGTFKGNLTVTNNIPGANGLSQAKEQAFNITIAMPADMACKGGSTGNVCIVRCRNNSVAGPFGGCVAVIQSDVTPETAASNNQANTKAAKAKTEKLKAQAKA